jgi:hypothetical protein
MSIPEASGETPLSARAIEAISEAVRAEFDKVLPDVLGALRRNNAFDEISDRLRTAERRIEARRERPVIIGLHRVLDRIRHLDLDKEIEHALEADIIHTLAEAGYQETGAAGEEYDPVRHVAIGGHAVNGSAVVTTVHARGLTSFGDVVVQAKVEISPVASPAADAAGSE